jgi:hypothetical protein
MPPMPYITSGLWLEIFYSRASSLQLWRLVLALDDRNDWRAEGAEEEMMEMNVDIKHVGIMLKAPAILYATDLLFSSLAAQPSRNPKEPTKPTIERIVPVC